MQIYLAPLEGITGYIYRNAFNKYYGSVDKYFTPFLSNRNMNHKEANDICPEHNRDINLVPQILANQAEVFLIIEEQLEALGYKEVNLNLGCPVGTVVSKKRGSGFLSVPDQLDAFLEEIFNKSKLPISIKTRIGVEQVEEWDKILPIYQKYPLTELIVHPRLQKEMYNGKSHFDVYLQTCQKWGLPLCYNGDITDRESFSNFEKQAEGYTFDRIMIGRGAIANPGLAGLLRDEETAAVDEAKVFKLFHDEILEGYIEVMSGEMPVLFKMKELWAFMGPFRNASEKDMKKLRKAKGLAEYKSIVERIL